MNNRRNRQKPELGKEVLVLILCAIMIFTGTLSVSTGAETPNEAAGPVYTLRYRCEYASQYEPFSYPGELTFDLYRNGEKTSQTLSLTAEESQSTETVTKTLDIADYDAAASYTLELAEVPASWQETASESGKQTDVVLSYKYTVIVSKRFVYPPQPSMSPGRKDLNNDSGKKDGVLKRSPSNPESVTVNLLDSGGKVIRTLTLKQSEDWSVQVELSTDEMSRFDHVTEEGADGWIMRWSIDRQNNYCYAIGLVNEVSTTTFTVKKLWDDKNNSGKRPDSITMNLYQDGLLYSTKTVDVVEKRRYDQTILFEDVPVGHEYYVQEEDVDGYSTEYGEVTSSGGNIEQTVINHINGHLTRFIVRKNWVGTPNNYPDVGVTIYDAETGEPAKDANGNLINGTIEFDKYFNGYVYDKQGLDSSKSYYAVEDKVEGYTPVYSQVTRNYNSDGSVILRQTITNVQDNLPLELCLCKDYVELDSHGGMPDYKPDKTNFRVYEEGHPESAVNLQIDSSVGDVTVGEKELQEKGLDFDPATKNYVFEEETPAGWKKLSEERQWIYYEGKIIYLVNIKNYPVSSLTVRKQVTAGGMQLPEGSTLKDETTRFRVTLHNDPLSASGSGLISGTYGDITFSNGTAVFSLKDGESKTASDLPAGTSYTVEELNASDCTVSANLSYTDLSGKARSRTVSIGRITDKTLFNTNQVVTVKNDFPAASLEASVVWDDSGNIGGVRPDAAAYKNWIRVYRQIGSGNLTDITEQVASHLAAAKGNDSDTYRIRLTGLPNVSYNSAENRHEEITYYLEQVQPAVAGKKYSTVYTAPAGDEIEENKLSGTAGFIGTITNSLPSTGKGGEPDTGDASRLFLWLAIMVVTEGLLLARLISGHRKASKNR